MATGLAAVVIGLASEAFRRGTRVHRPVIILSGIIPALPGLTEYRGYSRTSERPRIRPRCRWAVGPES